MSVDPANRYGSYFNSFDFSNSIFSDKFIPKKTENDSPSKQPYSLRKKFLPPLYEVPEPWHYTPNYNAIYKKIPSVIIVNPLSNKRKPLRTQKEKNNKSSSHSIDNSKENENELQHNTNTTDDNNNSTSNSPVKKRNKVFQTELSVSSSRSKSLLPPVDYFGKNHALRFSQYPNRKSNIYPYISKQLTYIEPSGYSKNKNKAVDFRKMKKRGKFNLINSQHLYTPGFNYYEPKYEVVEKTAKKISFSPRKKFKPDKKFLVKQLWSSYNVPLEYQVIKECNSIQKEIEEEKDV